ncbi:MAG: amino acid ABC transporter permease [Cardiobacteriaceae bacterium]|nr:amino acid ABC transporter permease [Cardiobacteriaceae bacterium]
MGFNFLWEGQNFNRLLMGLAQTLGISFFSLIFSLFFGTLLGLLLVRKNKFLHYLCQFYLETIRIVPLLVWLFTLYFGLATWFNLHLSAFWVCVLVFSLWGTAEMGDLVRGALQSISPHQRETAMALALDKRLIFFKIELPQMLKMLLPSTINLLTRIIKTTALGALIGVVEVVKVGQQIIETSLFSHATISLWVYGLIFWLYFLICYPLSHWAKRLEEDCE